MKVGLFGNHAGVAELLDGLGVDVLMASSSGPVPHLQRLRSIGRLEDFFLELEHHRLFLLDLPPGPDVDRVIDESYVVMEPGDVVIDLTASYWGDTLRRFRRMRHRSIFYVDAALFPDRGVALLAGDRRGTDLAAPLLERMAPPGGAIRAGEAGAAHFVRMVQAGLAMAFQHAVSEARQLLEAYPNEAHTETVVEALWPECAEASASAAWLLDDAVRLHAVIPLLAQSVMLELGTALDDHRSVEVPPRVGGFVHPDDIL
jgi:6-phosphogluconate dehydrogenase